MEKDMTKGRPLPVILKFMLPLIIGNIFQQLYNMADTIIVGRYVGADALAAVDPQERSCFLLWASRRESQPVSPYLPLSASVPKIPKG